MTLLEHVRHRAYWGYAGIGTAGTAVLLVVAGESVYRVALACLAVAAATLMAIGDSRTGLLRNAWTAPFGAAAACQTLIAGVASARPIDFGIAVALALLGNVGLYGAMGIVGWVGFGDVKLMVGLSLIAAMVAGATSVLLAPLTVLCAAVQGVAFSRVRAARTRRPHGPALVAGFAILLVAAFIIPIP